MSLFPAVCTDGDAALQNSDTRSGQSDGRCMAAFEELGICPEIIQAIEEEDWCDEPRARELAVDNHVKSLELRSTPAA